MSVNMNVGLVFDVDLTVTEEYQQTPIFRKHLEAIRTKYDGARNPEVVNEPEDYFPVLCAGLDMGVGSMEQLLIDARDGTFPELTNEAMRDEFGPQVKLAPGIEEWFPAINKFAEKLGQNLTSHAISAGVKPLIEGLTIARHFTSIHAGEYTQRDGKLIRVKSVVNPHNKTDHLKTICKGEEISRRRRLEDYRIHYDKVVGFGDGGSDQRILNFLRELGGLSIGVFRKGDQEDYYRAIRDLAGFAHYIVPRDYTRSSVLDQVVREGLEKMAARTCNYNFRLVSQLKLNHLRHPDLLEITKWHLQECEDCQERSKPTQFYFN